MSDDMKKMGEALAALQAQIAGMSGGAPAAAPGFGPPALMSGGGFGAPMAAPGEFGGISIPIEIYHQQAGKLRLYVQLSGAAIASSQTLEMALTQANAVAQQYGGNVAWYQPRQGGGFGGGNRGGYGGGRGGYGGGGGWNGGGNGGRW